MRNSCPTPIPGSGPRWLHIIGRPSAAESQMSSFAYLSDPGFLKLGPPSAATPYAVAGIAWDGATTNRPGARFGPRAVRQASQMLCDATHPHFDCSPLGHLGDAGDLALPNTSIEAMRSALAPLAAQWIGRHHMAWIGGDHSITLPLLRAYRAHLGRPLAVIHLDAHCDTWTSHFGEPSGHGTWVYEAMQEGLVLDACFILDETGGVLCYELSPDNMRVKRAGWGADPRPDDEFDKDLWRSGADPERLLKRLPLELSFPGSQPRAFRLRLPRLPSPWHLALGLLTARGASLAEKISAARCMRSLQRDRYRLGEDCTVTALLDRHGQRGSLRRHLWEALCLAALNTAPERASANQSRRA